jgi:predicted CopG family antitoxin
MAEEPTDAVPHILIRIQDSISAVRSELGTLRAELGEFKRENETQHEEIRGLIHKQRRGSAAMMVIMRATVSDFDERVNEIVERVAVLEARTG